MESVLNPPAPVASHVLDDDWGSDDDDMEREEGIAGEGEAEDGKAEEGKAQHKVES